MSEVSARADRWKAFYEEEGGLRDVLEGLRMTYFRRHGDLAIRQTEERYALALADKIIAEIDRHVREVIDSGDLEQMRSEHAERVAKMPPYLRRIVPG